MSKAGNLTYVQEKVSRVYLVTLHKDNVGCGYFVSSGVLSIRRFEQAV